VGDGDQAGRDAFGAEMYALRQIAERFGGTVAEGEGDAEPEAAVAESPAT